MRLRLFERLEVGLQSKLTLIAAPAGFGKTTLLSAWRAEGGSNISPGCHSTPGIVSAVQYTGIGSMYVEGYASNMYLSCRQLCCCDERLGRRSAYNSSTLYFFLRQPIKHI